MARPDHPLAGGVELTAALLEVSNLSARRGHREVLSSVSFSVRPNEILGVIGPNGAGKTTLFECVAGLLPRTGGTVRGESFFYMPDAIRPWPDQTVRWTLDLFDDVWGRAEARPPFDLEGVMEQRVKTLSKGEAKRLDLAIAFSAPHAILFLDEPFDGLDLRQTRAVMDVLCASQRTLVLSIHQLTDAARVCDRFLLLDNGRSIAAGTLEELGGENLEEVFLARTTAQRDR